MTKTVFLKVSSAFLVGGQLAKAGEIVEVTGTEAKDLLARGKATVATVADAPVEQEQEQEQHQDEGHGDEAGQVAGVGEENGEVVPLAGMKKADLAALAEGMGIEVADKTKADLIAAIEAEQVKAGE